MVGESHRQQAFDQTVGPRREHGPAISQVTVQLVREPSNRHDPDAVVVYIEASQVGYIPRQEARRWHPVLDELQRAGQPAVSLGLPAYSRSLATRHRPVSPCAQSVTTTASPSPDGRSQLAAR